MTNDEIESERQKMITRTLAVSVLVCAVLASSINVFKQAVYKVSYLAESKTLVIKGPNGNRIDLVGFIESTNTPTYTMHNVGLLRQCQHEAVAEFATDVLAAAAMNPVCDTNSALAVSEAFFEVANKRKAAATRDVEDLKKGEIHE